MEIKGFITNLGKYNEGYLIGWWIEFPIEEDDLADVLKKIGVSDEPDADGNYYEEYFFTDWESDCELGFGEYESIEGVNEIAEQVSLFDESQDEVLQGLMDNGFDLAEAIDIIENGEYIVYWDCETMTDVAHRIIDEQGLLEDSDDLLARYFDFEAYGRDIEFDGTFLETSNGYVEVIR